MVRQNLPSAERFLGVRIPGMQGYVIESLVGSGNNAHVFRARNEEIQNDAACKVIPKANLVGASESPPRWWEEIQKANRLASSRVIKAFEKGEFEGDLSDCVFILSNYVPSISLRRYLREERDEVGVRFVTDFLGEMLDFLRELEDESLRVMTESWGTGV